MTAGQTAMYFAEWGKLRDVLRASGLSHAEIENERHALTQRALGRAKSSKAFTNAELDKVLAHIAATREPGNLNAQMAIQDSPDKRRASAEAACLKAAGTICGQETGAARYVAGVCRSVIKKEFAECTAEELSKVQGVLTAQVRRMQKRATTPAEDDDSGNPF